MQIDALVFYLIQKFNHETRNEAWKHYTADMLRTAASDKRFILDKTQRFWDLVNEKNVKATQEEDRSEQDIINMFKNASAV